MLNYLFTLPYRLFLRLPWQEESVGKCKEVVQHTESLSGTFLDIEGMKVNYLLPVFQVVENITNRPCSQEKGILGVEKTFAFMNNVVFWSLPVVSP